MGFPFNHQIEVLFNKHHICWKWERITKERMILFVILFVGFIKSHISTIGENEIDEIARQALSKDFQLPDLIHII